MSSGELKSYQLKVCDLESAVASKEQELKTRADLLQKKEATIQRLSKAKSDTSLLANTWRKDKANSRPPPAICFDIVALFCLIIFLGGSC